MLKHAVSVLVLCLCTFIYLCVCVFSAHASTSMLSKGCSTDALRFWLHYQLKDCETGVTLHPSSCMCMAGHMMWMFTSLLPEVLDALLLPYCPGSQLLSCWKETIKFSTIIRTHSFKNNRRSWWQKKSYHQTSSLQISSFSLWSLCTWCLEVFIAVTEFFHSSLGSRLNFVFSIMAPLKSLMSQSLLHAFQLLCTTSPGTSFL